MQLTYEILQNMHHLITFGSFHNNVLDTCGAFEPFQIPRQMFAHLAYSDHFALKGNETIHMQDSHADFFFGFRIRQQLPGA
ncbi:hypothetical protein D3C76_1728920 [compost metagenome]